MKFIQHLYIEPGFKLNKQYLHKVILADLKQFDKIAKIKWH